MTDAKTEETVLFFATTDDIDLTNAAERFVEIAGALGADPDSAQMVGPLDLVITGPGIQITMSICDTPLATQDFLKGSRPEAPEQDDDDVFTAIALHEAAIVLRFRGEGEGHLEALARLTACLIGRMPVAAIYCVSSAVAFAPREFLSARASSEPVRPRRVMARQLTRAPRPAPARVRAQLPEVAASVDVLAAAMREAQADAQMAAQTGETDMVQASKGAGRLAQVASLASSLPILRIFSQGAHAS
ncbi:hypothetical protein [Anianabacter salinae]|uniref:hypothetical protein n=1 Tax=Anianabacter salinae TaxID=2851023 RepID=UPI00225E2384|nr:hypothetical protein [Anianabacter salinae]MBV0912919.1 hypothetical protein [Anianabacter salinae]